MEISKRAQGISPSLTLEITAKAKSMKAAGKDVVSFGAGEPDFNTPDYIVAAAKEALDKGVTRYTAASGTPEVKKAICEALKADGMDYEPSQIVVSNGAKHCLTNAFLCTVNEGDEVIIPAPFWLTYPELVKLAGGVPVILKAKKENGYKITVDDLKKTITPKTKAILLCNPCNPSGIVYSKDEIFAFAKFLEDKDIYIISDEIYNKLSYDTEVVSISTYSEKIKEKTIVINGVSKSYAMTGWRIGWSASNAKLAKAMGSLQSHCTSNPNSIAQYATVAAYTKPEGKEFISSLYGVFKERRDLMVDVLGKMGADIIKPQGAFYVMVDVSRYFGKKFNGEVIDSAHKIAMLLIDNYDMAVIPCESFGADNFIRLSYAISKEDILKGLDRLNDFFGKIA